MVDAIKILVDQLDLPDDVIGIIHEHLQGYYQYRRCARELLMPHFHRSLASIITQIPKWYTVIEQVFILGETWLGLFALASMGSAPVR